MFRVEGDISGPKKVQRPESNFMNFPSPGLVFMDSEALGAVYIQKSELWLHFFLHKSKYPDSISTDIHLNSPVFDFLQDQFLELGHCERD